MDPAFLHSRYQQVIHTKQLVQFLISFKSFIFFVFGDYVRGSILFASHPSFHYAFGVVKTAVGRIKTLQKPEKKKLGSDLQVVLCAE